MPMVRRNEPIATWEAGDYVQGFALLKRKDVRQDRNGRDYLDLEVGDASASIPAKVWPDSAAIKGQYEAHDFVAFKGTVRLYRELPQLNVEHCRQVNDDDRSYGFDEGLLIPTTPESLEDLDQRLQRIYPGTLTHPALRRLAEEALARYGAALREHPAAKTVHHAYRGGLLEHVVSMAELADMICGHYGEIDRDLVLLGVLFHDLGKLRELGAMPANDYTLEGRLVGHVVIGRDLVLECAAAVDELPAELRLHLEHLVLSHQGKHEYGTPIEPMTPEAFVLHAIDDLDSKLNQLRNARGTGETLQYIRFLGRTVYLPEAAAPPLATEAASAEAGDENRDENGD